MTIRHANVFYGLCVTIGVTVDMQVTVAGLPLHQLATGDTVTLSLETSPDRSTFTLQPPRVTLTGGDGRSRWQIIILIFILASSIFANGIVFAVFRRKPSLLTISNRFVLNLSTCNMLLTAWVVPMSLSSLMTGGWPLRQAGCVVSAVVTMLLLTASTFSVLLISLDRYVAIVRPLHYPTLMTSRTVTISLAVVWGTSLLVALPPVFGIGHVTYDSASFTCNVLWTARDVTDRAYVFFVCTACFVLPFVVMLFIYLCVFCTAVRNSSRLRRNSAPHPLHALRTVLPHSLVALVTLPAPPSANTHNPVDDRRRSSSMSLLNSASSNSTSQMGRRRSSVSLRGLLTQYRDDIHAAKTALLVVSTFALCWLPVFVLIFSVQTSASQQHLHQQQEQQETGSLPPPPSHSWSRFCVVWLTQLSCFINPLVYVFRSRLVYGECRKMLTCAQPLSATRSSRISLALSSTLHLPGSVPALNGDPESVAALALPRPSSLHVMSQLRQPEDSRLSRNSQTSGDSLSILKSASNCTIRTADSTNIIASPTKGVTFHIGADDDLNLSSDPRAS